MIERIRTYPFFQEKSIISCEPLEQQGHANTIYLIKTPTQKYLLREFKISIDRQVEFAIQQKAYQNGIGAKPILLDREGGLMISEFIEGEHREKLTQQQLKKIARLLRKLHKIKIRQKRNSFKKNFTLKDKKVQKAFMVLNREKREYALGHNDLHPQNILFQKHHIKLIDWEYARYSDIYFDLVSIIIEYKLNRKESAIFLRNYFQREKINHKKIEAFKVIYRELWKQWFKKLERGEL